MKKAASEEGSLFSSCADEADGQPEQEEIETDCEAEADDGYSFEEDNED